MGIHFRSTLIPFSFIFIYLFIYFSIRTINVDAENQLSASTYVDANSNLVDPNTFPAYEIVPASVLASTLEWTLILIFWYNYQRQQ